MGIAEGVCELDCDPCRLMVSLACRSQPPGHGSASEGLFDEYEEYEEEKYK